MQDLATIHSISTCFNTNQTVGSIGIDAQQPTPGKMRRAGRAAVRTARRAQGDAGHFLGSIRYVYFIHYLYIYPLVNVYITMENHHAVNGKTHYFDWAIFNSYVSLPEGIC